MAKVKKRLGEILVESGVITEDSLGIALDIQRKSGKKLGEVLVTEGFTTNEQIVEVLKRQLGLRLINLDNVNIRQNIIDTIPETIARKNEVIPVDIINGQLLVAMSDPLNYYAIEEIKVSTGYAVKPAIALRYEVLNNIEKYYGQNKAREAAEDYKRVYGFRAKDNNSELMNDESAAPIIKFLNTIIENSILNNASDIHIEPSEDYMRVRFRIDGVLREMMKVDMGMLEPVLSRVKIMANLNIAEKRIPQDGRINYIGKGKNIDLRIAVSPTVWGEKIVMRILDKSNFECDLENLGLAEGEIDKIKRIIAKPYGIILVCGPTGSGKTTTLYSILNILNNSSKNIVTLEDPVEYSVKGINQMQVNTKIGLTFASGLRSILRQDPDIIMVGEIRDSETAEISTRSALTGHLVLSTIHTNDAVGTITRLKDMGIASFLLSSTLSGVIAQRLVRKVCPACGKEHSTDEREMKLLGISDPKVIKRGEGCGLCNNTGYKGREGIYEIIEITNELRNMIDMQCSELEIQRKAIEDGMIQLKEACVNKVLQGVTTVEEMMRVTYGY